MNQSKETIDWHSPGFQAFCLTCMIIVLYAGELPSAITWLFMAWTDAYMQGSKEKLN